LIFIEAVAPVNYHSR